MINCLPWFMLLASGDVFPYAAAEAELSVAVNESELQAHVYRLASPEFQGRSGDGATRAAEHVAEKFKRLKLAPAFGESYFQPIPSLLKPNGGGERVLGRNVAAVLPGSDPKLRDEWIILSAHFDHLGTKGASLFPGADDNASGVAMLLEVAEWFALKQEKPRRTVMFLSCDLEERGLQGATHFAAHPPRDFKNLKAFLVADILGRSQGDIMEEYFFVLGSETSRELRKVVTETQPANGLKAARLGADLVGTRSDYGPFRDRKVPFLFFTTGTHRDYHRVTDLPDRLDYAKLTKISQWIAAVTERIANDDAPPNWNPAANPSDPDELRTVQILLTRVLERNQTIKLTDAQRIQVKQARDRIQEIAKRDKITAEERTWLVWTARWLLISVF